MRELPISGAMTRRTALRRVLLGAAAYPLVQAWGHYAWAGADPPAPAVPPRPARATAVIEIWMSGGPSHIDTFDPKPEAGANYCGPLDKPIATNAGGMRISELLPLLAAQADKYSLIRSLTHGVNGHETATYAMQTGRKPGERLVHPGLGAVVSALRGYDHGYKGLIPPYVVLTTPLGRFEETGFLGPRYQPFVTGGDPNQRRFAVEGIVSEGITDARQSARRNLLHSLDTLGKAMPGDPLFVETDRCEDKAYDLILGDARQLFELSRENDELRDRYGRTSFGQSCLMARRLVEQGVPYITVQLGGWDTHKQHFEAMRRKLPEFDRGVATLLADLSDRGLLGSTVVWCSGEFGRTPKVMWEAPWNGGRGHHGDCFSALVAGGGFKGGQVLGSSDAKGEQPKDRPVPTQELLGAICELLGIDPDGPMPNPLGLDMKVMPTEGAAAGVRRLKELV